MQKCMKDGKTDSRLCSKGHTCFATKPLFESVEEASSFLATHDSKGSAFADLLAQDQHTNSKCKVHHQLPFMRNQGRGRREGQHGLLCRTHRHTSHVVDPASFGWQATPAVYATKHGKHQAELQEGKSFHYHSSNAMMQRQRGTHVLCMLVC